MHYELRKIFFKRANQIALIMLAILTFYTCMTSLRQVEWVDDEGNVETGHSAAVKLQEASEEWSGILDQELLEKALAELKDIYSSTEVDAQSEESNWLLRSKLQGVQEIADLIGLAYMYPICKKHNIKFDLLLSDISYPILYSDKHSITQILVAFLDNALSHAKNSSRIQITTTCTKSTFTIYVVDHGCGIPDEVKPYIFDPFFCGDASHTDRSHFGLGLSIAQSLVKGLNGSIGILDTDGGGATFILNLPLDRRIAVSSPKNVSEKL